MLAYLGPRGPIAKRPRQESFMARKAPAKSARPEPQPAKPALTSPGPVAERVVVRDGDVRSPRPFLSSEPAVEVQLEVVYFRPLYLS